MAVEVTKTYEAEQQFNKKTFEQALIVVLQALGSDEDPQLVEWVAKNWTNSTEPKEKI